MDTNAPRTDDQLAQRVRHALCRAGYAHLARVHCQAHAATVTLTGELPNFYHAQLAQTIASHVPGVRRVDNQVNVMALPLPAHA